MTSRRLGMVLMVAAAVALIGAGCGGSSDESLTKAEFVKQGNAICAKEKKQLSTELKGFLKDNPKASTADGGKFIGDVILPNFQSQVDQLRELPAPEGDEEEVAEMLDMLEGGIEAGGKDPASFFLADESEFTKGAEKAEKYGLEGCMSAF